MYEIDKKRRICCFVAGIGAPFEVAVWWFAMSLVIVTQSQRWQSPLILDVYVWQLSNVARPPPHSRSFQLFPASLIFLTYRKEEEEKIRKCSHQPSQRVLDALRKIHITPQDLERKKKEKLLSNDDDGGIHTHLGPECFHVAFSI